MAGHQAPLSLALLAFLVLALAPAEARNLHKIQHRSLSEIGAICEYASFPDKCRELIPKLSVQSPEALTQASLQAAVSYGQEAAAAADKLLEDPAASEEVKKAVAQCKAGYNEAIKSLKSAEELLSASAADVHLQMMHDISMAVLFSGKCDDISSQKPELGSPLHSYNSMLSRLVTNSLSLAMGAKLQ